MQVQLVSGRMHSSVHRRRSQAPIPSLSESHHPMDHTMDHVATGASPVPPKRSKAEPTQPPNANHSANPTTLVIPTRAKRQAVNQTKVNDSSAYTPSAQN